MSDEQPLELETTNPDLRFTLGKLAGLVQAFHIDLGRTRKAAENTERLINSRIEPLEKRVRMVENKLWWIIGIGAGATTLITAITLWRAFNG